MECAFEVQRADFGKMVSAVPGTCISEVKPKTYVDVDGKGTEAAAVTSVKCGATPVQVDRLM